MNSKIFLILFLFNLIFFSNIKSQDQSYVPETDPLVLQKLEDWQDLKFGLLIHWGTYSIWGIVESWSICPADFPWCKRISGSNPQDYFSYVAEYQNLKTKFNPKNFQPQKWAIASKKAGIKYMIFTTKHHDGFCMYDSKETNYKVTDPECPFHINEKADITKEVFKAFREEGLWVGAYFSKADWNSKYYWDPYFPPFDYNVNYDPELHPDKWENFVRFTHNQIMELMSNYGKVDILWLDGGWVAKKPKDHIADKYKQRLEKNPFGFIKDRTINQDIRMDDLVIKVREKQPGLLVVDRLVEGKNQNYLTPESMIPPKEILVPWESCIIAGGGWPWNPEAHFMTPRFAIHMLVDIVSKGGNLLLDIGPSPEGEFHPAALNLLNKIGAWFDINGEGIYETRVISPYREAKGVMPPFMNAKICFTNKKNTKDVYAIYLADEEEKSMPTILEIASFKPSELTKISLLGFGDLKWEKTTTGIRIIIPEKISNNPPCDYAWTFKLEKLNIRDN